MLEPKAIYHGQVQLVPGLFCDAYILNDKSAVMSTRGTADLLNMDHKALKNMGTKSLPKGLRPFISSEINMGTKKVKVEAKSHYRGRYIDVYTINAIEALIKAYAFAFANDKLRQNQKHIGKRCVLLMGALLKTALDITIREACGLSPNSQKTAQRYYMEAAQLIKSSGFRCSVSENIATKKDILTFLNTPQSTLNSFLYKHSYEIKPLKLDSKTIQSIGCKARRLYGYHLEDVIKIIFGMDTAVGIKLKKEMFGDLANYSKMYAKDEIQWREVLIRVFKGFDLRFNYPIGQYRYRVDFFVPELLLCLECNGYSHHYYDKEKEAKREKIISEEYALVRFHHKIDVQDLFNAILHAKPGKIVKLYNVKKKLPSKAPAK